VPGTSSAARDYEHAGGTIDVACFGSEKHGDAVIVPGTSSATRDYEHAGVTHGTATVDRPAEGHLAMAFIAVVDHRPATIEQGR